MSEQLKPFDPDRDFDAIADYARKQVAEAALKIVRSRRYKEASKRDQIEGYLAGLVVGCLGAAIAATEPGAEGDVRAHMRTHFDFYFNRALELNNRPPLEPLQ
jgi:hypothetical protein